MKPLCICITSCINLTKRVMISLATRARILRPEAKIENLPEIKSYPGDFCYHDQETHETCSFD